MANAIATGDELLARRATIGSWASGGRSSGRIGAVPTARAQLRRTLIQGVAGEDVETRCLRPRLEFGADGRKRRDRCLHTGAYSTDFPGLHTLILADTRYRMLSVVRFRDEATFLRRPSSRSSTSPRSS